MNETHTYPDGSQRVGSPPFPKKSPLESPDSAPESVEEPKAEPTKPVRAKPKAE